MPDATIKFLRPWRGREAGQVLGTLDYGVAQTLVLRGIAQWHGVPATVTPPVLPGSFTPAKVAAKGKR